MSLLRKAIEGTEAFCKEQGIDLQAIQAAPAENFRRIGMVDDAVDALVANDEIKKKYLLLSGEVTRLFKAILPDKSANDFSASVALIVVMAERIRLLEPEADIRGVMREVENLLDLSVATRQYVIRESGGSYDTSSASRPESDRFRCAQPPFRACFTSTQKSRSCGEPLISKLTRMVRSQQEPCQLPGTLPAHDRRVQRGQRER